MAPKQRANGESLSDIYSVRMDRRAVFDIKNIYFDSLLHRTDTIKTIILQVYDERKR